MFRRKEESLFDNTTDPNQVREPVESANIISNQHTPAQPAHATTSAYGAGAQAAQPASSMPRPPASQQSSGFRSSAPIGGDLTRNRMPEAPKPAIPSAPAAFGDRNKSVRRVLTVGNDILLKGEIATCDRLVIEGKVDATLNDVHTVEIAENGSFKGSAHIEDAEISGLFEGDLVVRNRLVIYATGKVRGKITYGEIEIERGGELTGEIKTSASGSQQVQSSPRQRQPKEDKAAA